MDTPEGRLVRVGRDLSGPFLQRLGTVEREDPATPGVLVIAVREPGFFARRLVDEGKRVHRRFDPVGKAVDVPSALVLHLRQRGALRLGLDDAGGLPIDEQQVVDSPVALLQDEFTNSDARASADVGVVRMLHKPAGKDELPIYLYPRPRLPCEVVMIGGGHDADDSGRSRYPPAVAQFRTAVSRAWRRGSSGLWIAKIDAVPDMRCAFTRTGARSSESRRCGIEPLGESGQGAQRRRLNPAL